MAPFYGQKQKQDSHCRNGPRDARQQCRRVALLGWFAGLSTEAIRLVRDGEKGGKGYGGGGRGRLYTYRYTVTTRMTSALRWAAMRAILIFHNCEGQSHTTVSTDHNFSLSERRAEADSNRGPSAYQPNALPLRHAGSERAVHQPLALI